MDEQIEADWYAVRCVFRHPLPDGQVREHPFTYEERVTIWRAGSFEEAIAKAEEEADEYASNVDCEKTDLVQAYFFELRPEEGSEVFSLMRDSALTPTEYLDHYFDDGGERQRTTS